VNGSEATFKVYKGDEPLSAAYAFLRGRGLRVKASANEVRELASIVRRRLEGGVDASQAQVGEGFEGGGERER
jgi:hypothetical protein